VDDAAAPTVGVGAAELLLVDVLTGHRPHDVGAGDEDPPGRTHDHQVGEGRAVRGTAGGRAQEPKKKDADEGKKGTVTGLVTAKGDNWIEVKADGEEKPRRYMPNWKGGLPKDGGGPDKDVVAKIKETPVKARVRLEWSFHERPRVEKIEVLKAEKE